MKVWSYIFFLLTLLAASLAFAQGTAGSAQSVPSSATADSAKATGIVFNGVVQDSSFAPGEKLNVEILESGEALQTTVGTPFSVVLPEDTLWNICVTNSDTAGAEKEKCYELKYVGVERAFSQALGDGFVMGEGESLPLAPADCHPCEGGDLQSSSATPSSGGTPPKGGHAHISAEALSGQRPQRPLNNPSLKDVVTPASVPGRLQKRPSVATSLCSSLPSGRHPGAKR